jgi:hypothetical protein
MPQLCRPSLVAMAMLLLPETVKKPTLSAACGVLWPVFQLADQQTEHVAIHVRHMQAKFPALYKSIQV